MVLISIALDVSPQGVRMAALRRHGKGWRAENARCGVRKSTVFATQREAKDWAARTGYELAQRDWFDATVPFGGVLHRDTREVLSRKRGHWRVETGLWERRCDALRGIGLPVSLRADGILGSGKQYRAAQAGILSLLSQRKHLERGGRLGGRPTVHRTSLQPARYDVRTV